MTIDILCKVVDNYGDIGVVYRLARALTDLDPGLQLRLVVDGLASFHALMPEVDPEAAVQVVGGWTIVRWDCPWEGFLRERPRRVIECFACGRPEWLDAILFDPAATETCLILNLEYLSAEGYAQDFHLLEAATRSPYVKKYFFMPGFSVGTGGLLIDRRFGEARSRFLDPSRRGEARRDAARGAGLSLSADEESRYWILIFSYERDYTAIVRDLAAYDKERPLLALVASGRSAAPFIAAWEAAGRPFPMARLPFLRQEAWDDVLLSADFSIVRGEESLARAALSGRPFLWHAYLQHDGYQLVKVRALLERMRPYFQASPFAGLEALALAFNDRLKDGSDAGGAESLLPVLERSAPLKAGFLRFSEEVLGLGDLASHLLTFLIDFV